MKNVLKIAIVCAIVVTGMQFVTSLSQSLGLGLSKKQSNTLVRPNNGEFREYYADGTIKSFEYYHYGMKDSVWSTYFPNGRMKQEITYHNNKIHGDVSHYSVSGQLVFVEKYKNGILKNYNVLNDSLYRYEFQLATHGESVFKSSCGPCHLNYSDISKFSAAKFLKDSDSLGNYTLSIDTLHSELPDSMYETIVNQADLNPVSLIGSKDSLNRYDLEAILNFIEKEKESDNLTKWFRRIRRPKRKKKISYVPKIGIEAFMPRLKFQ